jgi:UDP-N-acetylglucosamine:LPS N-acetylglucosamine transferase
MRGSLSRRSRDANLTVTEDPSTFDILMVADLSRRGDVALRVRRELQVLAGAGYSCGLCHLPAKDGRTIAAEVQRTVAEGLARPVLDRRPVTARLAIVQSPGHFRTLPTERLAQIRAERVVLVVDRPPEPEHLGFWFSFAFGPMTWAPTNRWVRERLQAMALPVPLSTEDWRAIAAPAGARPDTAPGRLRPVLGRVGTHSRLQWPDSQAEIAALHPGDGRFDVWLFGKPPADLVSGCTSRDEWTVLPGDAMSIERFVEAVDGLVVCTRGPGAECPDSVVAAAMVSDRPVVLSPHLEPHFGPEALYAAPAEAEATLARFLDRDAAARAKALGAVRARARLLFSADAYLERIAALVGPPPARTTAPSDATPRRPRVLFVPSNGVGLGHATRLLAIARRLEASAEPVFACLGQAAATVEGFGYRAEYIPSHTDIGADLTQWDAWFGLQLRELIARYAPDAVVYDGNHPTPGLVRAALADGRCRLIWVRRGMAAPKPSPHLGQARFFDCIIEPGELARDRDRGPTARLRHEVRAVPPIRLLDADELLPREAARADLGLDPDRPAVLVQPGGDGTRDVVDLVDRLVADLRRFEALQIVIAEWSNGATALPRWAGTKRLRGFPVARVFRAFDFSVAAAGYNTYHDVIAHGLPSIFVANRHPSMDDQGARAAFAQDHGAGFDLTPEEMHVFPTLCRAMLTPEANAAIRANCAALEMPNGAAEAAEIVARLAGAP